MIEGVVRRHTWGGHEEAAPAARIHALLAEGGKFAHFPIAASVLSI
jgi:hypothetical protein